MACDGAFATPEDFTKQWFYDFANEVEESLWPLLKMSAGRIHAAMGAQGMCDCTLASWAEEYLKELNCVAAVVMFNLACVRLSNEQRELFSTYLSEQLTAIRTGELELCEGETAKDAPAFGVAQYGVTPINEARIIVSDYLRNQT